MFSGQNAFGGERQPFFRSTARGSSGTREPLYIPERPQEPLPLRHESVYEQIDVSDSFVNEDVLPSLVDATIHLRGHIISPDGDRYRLTSTLRLGDRATTFFDGANFYILIEGDTILFRGWRADKLRELVDVQNQLRRAKHQGFDVEEAYENEDVRVRIEGDQAFLRVTSFRRRVTDTF